MNNLADSCTPGQDQEEGQDWTGEMVTRADLCVRVAAEAGYRLDFEPNSVSVLEQMVEDLWGTQGPERPDVVAAVIGSYLGEVVRRHIGGDWAWNAEYQTPGLVRGEKWVFPLARAQKRLVDGRGDNLAVFYVAIGELQLL